MAVSFIGTATLSTSSNAGTLSRHASSTTGDLLIVAISGNNTTTSWTVTTPSGWTYLGTAQAQAGQRSHYYYKYIAAGDPTSEDWFWSLSQATRLTKTTYRGVVVIGSMLINSSGFDGTETSGTVWPAPFMTDVKETGILYSNFVSHSVTTAKTVHSSDTASALRLTFNNQAVFDRPLTKGVNSVRSVAQASTTTWTGMSMALYEAVPNELPTIPTNVVAQDANQNAPVPVSWTHNDPNLNTQSKYQLRWRKT